MNDLWLYDLIDRVGVRNYRAKVMLMAFIGTHIPLLTLVGYLALKSSTTWSTFFIIIGITLAATLVGTAFTLFALGLLLRPVVITSRALRSYVQARQFEELPRIYTDEAGTLMADTSATLEHLDRVRDALENLDATTGLPNRHKLLADIAIHLRPTDCFVACVIRLGNYARLVETLDRSAAEVAIAEIATRLRAALHDSHALYRIDGSSFVWLAKGNAARTEFAEPGTFSARVQDIISRCGSSVILGDGAVTPSLYAGLACYPADAGRPEVVVSHAIAAVSQASEAMPVCFHSPAARAASVERLRLEQDLHKAIMRDEFVLYYQPVIDLLHGRSLGAEALIRWQHPEKGLLLPSSFIGLAESSGLIDPIGLWVMRHACMQVRDWNTSGLPGMKVAINLSARQFLDPDLIAHVDEAIRASGISVDQLEIELTETAVMIDHAHSRSVFGKLRDLGVSIAIDDFGTAYASMSCLRKLPFDKLKIDREFVSNVHNTRDSQAICGALMELARGFDLRVVAEGVESADEIQFLWSRGCHLYQGFFFSKPLTSAGFRDGLHLACDNAARLLRQV